MFGAYKLGRIVAAKHVGTAFDNAYVVWDLERLLRLPDELSVQALMLHSTVGDQERRTSTTPPCTSRPPQRS